MKSEREREKRPPPDTRNPCRTRWGEGESDREEEGYRKKILLRTDAVVKASSGSDRHVK